jgi:hypothetical protein
MSLVTLDVYFKNKGLDKSLISIKNSVKPIPLARSISSLFNKDDETHNTGKECYTTNHKNLPLIL